MTEKIDFDVEIPKLHSYAVELADLTREMLPKVRHEEYDHLMFMTSTFVCKQLGHTKSVLTLVDSGQHADALSIARVMVEGLAILLWANVEPNERPLNWRAYVLIDQFKRSVGQPDYSEHQEYLETMLDKYCRNYLYKDYKNKPQREITPDSYLSNWRRDKDNDKNKLNTITIEKIFDAVGLKDVHDGFYDPASGWLHWDSFSMAQTIERKADGGIICGIDKKYMGVQAISNAIFALFGSTRLLDEHLKLGFSDRLMDFYKRVDAGIKTKAKIS